LYLVNNYTQDGWILCKRYACLNYELNCRLKNLRLGMISYSCVEQTKLIIIHNKYFEQIIAVVVVTLHKSAENTCNYIIFFLIPSKKELFFVGSERNSIEKLMLSFFYVLFCFKNVFALNPVINYSYNMLQFIK
jgi:hypothetical protein